MLTDFGLSKEGVLEVSNGAKSFCGSVAYLSPETLREAGHGKSVDWYLLGVLLYEMIVGKTPYFRCRNPAIPCSSIRISFEMWCALKSKNEIFLRITTRSTL